MIKKIINKYAQIISNLYFVFIGVLSYIVLSYTAKVFLFSNEITELYIFGGVLTITNFTMVFSIVRNYLKQRI